MSCSSLVCTANNPRVSRGLVAFHGGVLHSFRFSTRSVLPTDLSPVPSISNNRRSRALSPGPHSVMKCSNSAGEKLHLPGEPGESGEELMAPAAAVKRESWELGHTSAVLTVHVLDAGQTATCPKVAGSSSMVTQRNASAVSTASHPSQIQTKNKKYMWCVCNLVGSVLLCCAVVSTTRRLACRAIHQRAVPTVDPDAICRAGDVLER